MLACTDEAVLPVSQVFEAIRELGNDGVEQYDPLVVTSASSLSNSPAPSITSFVFLLGGGLILIINSDFAFSISLTGLICHSNRMNLLLTPLSYSVTLLYCVHLPQL